MILTELLREGVGLGVGAGVDRVGLGVAIHLRNEDGADKMLEIYVSSMNISIQRKTGTYDQP